MIDTPFKQILYSKRKAMSPKQRQRDRQKRLKTAWLYPFNQERKYYANIKKILKDEISIPFNDLIQNNLTSWLEQYNRRDAYPEDLQNGLNLIKNNLNGLFSGDQVRTMLTITALDVSDFNEKQFQKYMKFQIGFEYIQAEVWEQEVIAAWSQTNFELIKSLTEEQIKKLNTAVSEGVQFGKSAGEIKKEILKINKNMEIARAKLLARDQVGKLNGQFTQRRQVDAGIDLYIWTTAGDERVRGKAGGRYPKAIPSHAVMDGKIGKWGDANIYSDDGIEFKKRTEKMPKAIPGQEILCRCAAVPFFEDLKAEIDQIIEKEEAA